VLVLIFRTPLVMKNCSMNSGDLAGDVSGGIFIPGIAPVD
jgi:hypothetical protein